MVTGTSTSLGPFVFSNYGPMTTTFTPPASCVTGTSMIHIAYSSDPQNVSYVAECPSNEIYTTDTNCYPGLTTEAPSPSSLKPYYSPDLHCYNGWETVGVAVKGEDSFISTSGPFAPHQTWFNLGPIMFQALLKPSETAVLCCPSSMTVLDSGYCASLLEDYSVKTGCRWDYETTDYSMVTTTITVADTMRTLAWASMYESADVSPVTKTFSPSETSSYIGLSVIPMVAMIHSPADKGLKGSSDGSGNESDNGNESSEASEDGGESAGSRLDIPGLGSLSLPLVVVTVLFRLFIL